MFRVGVGFILAMPRQDHFPTNHPPTITTTPAPTPTQSDPSSERIKSGPVSTLL